MNWDKYFLDLSNVVASNSKCLSRKIGAIIVRDKSVISVGYNGPARGVPPCSQWPGNKSYVCPRKNKGYKSGEGLEFCPAAHGEANAVNNAARNGITLLDTTMYMNCYIPCKNCLTAIINSGISEIVVVSMEYYDTISEYIIKTSGLKVREYRL